MNEESIFAAALQLRSPDERAAFLNSACGGDDRMRSELNELLRASDQAGDFLEPPITEGPGCVIGPYKLLEQIGEGGMGIVLKAEQMAPVRRTVALKIIKPGMDTRQVIPRFEAERQALAMMDHPNIAKVLDAGTTGEGVGCQVSGR